jgi:GNAT superfamily N-acetyltransferase
VYLPGVGDLTICQPEPTEDAITRYLDVLNHGSRAALLGGPYTDVQGESSMLTEKDLVDAVPPDETNINRIINGINVGYSPNVERPIFPLQAVIGDEIVAITYMFLGKHKPAIYLNENFGDVPGHVCAAKLHQFCVAERWRGRRIGPALLATALRWASPIHDPDHTAYLRLNVFEGNAHAMRLYDSLGIQPTDRGRVAEMSDGIFIKFQERMARIATLQERLEQRLGQRPSRNYDPITYKSL